jgi:endonuclease III
VARPRSAALLPGVGRKTANGAQHRLRRAGDGGKIRHIFRVSTVPAWPPARTCAVETRW